MKTTMRIHTRNTDTWMRRGTTGTQTAPRPPLASVWRGSGTYADPEAVRQDAPAVGAERGTYSMVMRRPASLGRAVERGRMTRP